MKIEEYKELLSTELKYLADLPLKEIQSFADLIADRANRESTRIITAGIGKAGQIAHTLATTLSSTGTPSFFLHPTEAQHGDLGLVCQGDILVVFSNSGKTREVMELMELARNLFSDISILSITGDGESPIAKRSDHNISFGPVEEICPLGLTPTTSTTCMSVICDLIVVGVMNNIGFTRTEYNKRHHAGYLGIKSSH